nr:olfactory receptor 40 [Tropidothorax elegans]
MPVLAVTERFVYNTGLLYESNLKGRILSALIFSFALLSVVQLLCSIPLFVDDIESVMMIIYNAALYSTTPVAHILLNPIPLFEMLSGGRFTYDYEDPVMRPVQDSILNDIKIKNIKKITKSLPYMNLVMVGNLIVAALTDKFLFERRYLELYPIWYPSWVDQDKFWVNMLTFLLQLSTMTVAGFTIFSGFGCCYLFYNHLTCEFFILRRALELIEERAVVVATADGINMRQAYLKVVKLCVEHHILLFQYYNSIQPAVQRVYTLIYFEGLILLTCTGFAFTSENTTLKMKFVVITFIQLFFLFFISWFAEEVSDKGSQVNLTTYSVDWFSLPPECRSILRILLLVSQRPLIVRTSLGQPVDLAGFMSLVKASYSYFNMMLVATGMGEEGF